MGDQLAPVDPCLSLNAPETACHSAYYLIASPSPVSYQTAFWTLVPLAVSTMTQPSGRVLGSSPQYRTYLRSSPILCSVDALFFLLRLVFSPLVLRIPLRQAIEITIQERYRDIEDPVEGIQYLEKQTWLRWLWFVLGTLGPAIKLAAMQNVPWTKAWGMMFLGAFVVFESMIFLMKRDKRAGFESLAHEEPASIPAPVQGFMNVQINDINQCEIRVFVVAVLMHLGIVLWAIWDLWALQVPASQIAEELGTPRSNRLLQLVLLGYCISLLSFALMVPICFIFVLLSGDIIRLTGCLLFMGFFVYVIAFSGAKVDFLPILLGLPSFLNIILFLLTLIAPLFLEWVIRWLCSRYQSLSVNLLMVSETMEGSKPPSEATWTLVFFIVNLIVCNLWYCLRYDLTGTVYPSWTGVFG